MSAVVDFIVDSVYHGFEFFGRYYSEYRAYVVNNEDPKKEGRLQLLIPGIVDDESEYWAPSSGTFAGQGYGWHFIPPIGSLVWVSFENGSAEFPVWRHGYFGEKEIPSEKADVNNFWIATPDGHSIELDDRNKAIRITNTNGDLVTITKKGISLESKNIFLGTTDKGDQPAVMGDTLEKALKDIDKQLSDLNKEVRTIASNVNKTIGQLAKPSDAANIYTSALATNMISQAQILNTLIQPSLNKIDTINKSIANINEGLPKIKSKVVKLDYE